MKKLNDPQETLERLLDMVERTRGQTRTHTVPAPTKVGLEPGAAGKLLGDPSGGQRYAFEFRDPSWFDEKNYELLRSHGSFCVYDLNGVTSPQEITADFAYVRLHGPDGPYQGRYGAERLAGWASIFSAWLKEGLDVYCYFDNDEVGYAVQDALELRQMMAR